MKALFTLPLLLISLPALADLNCTGVIHNDKTQAETVVQLVKVTSAKRYEEYLGMAQGYSLYVAHDVQTARLYMDIVAPDGYLFATAIGPMNFENKTSFENLNFTMSCK